MAPEENKKPVSELITELLELTVGYIRQEIKSTIEHSVARPLRSAGRWAALALAASTLFALAAIFLAVGAFQLLAEIVGATWIAYLVIGGILLVAGIGTVIAMASGKETDNQ